MDATVYRRALGTVIRSLREYAGHSQEEFAEFVGVHRTYAGSVERGERNLSLKNLLRFATALNTTPSALLKRTEKELSSVGREASGTRKR